MLFGSPWWVWLYAMLIAGVGPGGVRDDLHEGRSLSNTLISFVPTLLLMSFILAYWYSRVAAGLGRAVWLLFSVAVVWEGTAAVRDLRKVRLVSHCMWRSWLPLLSGVPLPACAHGD